MAFGADWLKAGVAKTRAAATMLGMANRTGVLFMANLPNDGRRLCLFSESRKRLFYKRKTLERWISRVTLLTSRKLVEPIADVETRTSRPTSIRPLREASGREAPACAYLSSYLQPIVWTHQPSPSDVQRLLGHYRMLNGRKRASSRRWVHQLPNRTIGSGPIEPCQTIQFVAIQNGTCSDHQGRPHFEHRASFEKISDKRRHSSVQEGC